MKADIAALLAAIASAGSTLPAIVCAPQQAASIAVEMPTFAVPIWPSLGVEAGTVIAVDAAALLYSGGAVDIEASTQATVHMEDTTPLEIVSGTGPTTAAPVRSTYQTDTIALRLILDLAFALRSPGLIAHMEVSW